MVGISKLCIIPLLVVDNRWSEQGSVVDTVVETWVEATWAAVVVSKTMMESCNQLYLPDDGSRSSICQAVWTSQQSSDYAPVVGKVVK